MYVLGRNQQPMKKLIHVLKLHVEYNFNLKVFFLISTLSPFIISHQETVNCCNFLFVSTFVGDFGRELSCERAVRL